jgi:alkylated DNA repair dioxygenase AlkB
MDTLAWQASLFSPDVPGIDPAFPGLERTHLEPDAWIDHLPGWLGCSDAVFTLVRDGLPWAQRTERMQGRDVPQPRLTARLAVGRVAEELGDDLRLLDDMGRALSSRYGVRFSSIGLNLYRDGRDSVAWHGDRIARDLPTATIAIVSLGEARAFRYRPADGGRSGTFRLGHGDLLVMGGSFQRTWKHSVPKLASAGPRISVTYRHDYPPEPYPSPQVSRA